MAQQQPKVVFCGLTTFDLIYYTTSPLAANQKVTAEAALTTAGGPALNAAIAAAQLGLNAHLLTSIGTSPLAGAVRAELQHFGVHYHDYSHGPAPVPVSSVVVAPGGLRSVVSLNASGHQPQVPSLEFFGELLDDAACVLIDGHHPQLATAVVHAATARQIPIVLDGGSWKPVLADLLPFITVAAVSADFTAPPDAQPLLAQVPWRIITHGAQPIEFYHAPDADHPADPPAGDSALVPADPAAGQAERELLVLPRRSAVVDTLGAGDVFHGALVAALATSTQHAPLNTAAVRDGTRYGSKVAGLSVENRGPRLTQAQLQSLPPLG